MALFFLFECALNQWDSYLGTNSRKYGALSKPEGRVTVTWAVKNDRVRLQWSERFGPPVKVPRQHGFGTLLI